MSDSEQLDHTISANDLKRIISEAKNNFTNQTVPVMISRKQIEQPHIGHVAIINSFISYLNNKGLLKKLVKFDYTE